MPVVLRLYDIMKGGIFCWLGPIEMWREVDEVRCKLRSRDERSLRFKEIFDGYISGEPYTLSDQGPTGIHL